MLHADLQPSPSPRCPARHGVRAPRFTRGQVCRWPAALPAKAHAAVAPPPPARSAPPSTATPAAPVPASESRAHITDLALRDVAAAEPATDLTAPPRAAAAPRAAPAAATAALALDSAPASGAAPASAQAPAAAVTTAPASAAAAAAAPEAAHEPPHWLQRTSLLVGREGLAQLHNARVLVVGLGGVGSYVVEFLARAGVGNLAIMDGDVVDTTNINRQLPALTSTVGQPKAGVMAERLRAINPHLNLLVIQDFLEPDDAPGHLLADVAAAFNARGAAAGAAAPPSFAAAPTAACEGANTAATSSSSGPPAAASAAASSPSVRPPVDWVIDCIDSIAPKLSLLAAAHDAGCGVVSSMGAGGRMDPLAVEVADIADTWGDPFAASIRRGLRRRYGIRSGVTVVFSREPCRRASLGLVGTPTHYKRSYYGTLSVLPAAFGLHIASFVLNQITDGPMLSSVAARQRELRALRAVETCSSGVEAVPGPGQGAARTGEGAAARRRAARRAGADRARSGSAAAEQASSERQQQETAAGVRGTSGAAGAGGDSSGDEGDGDLPAERPGTCTGGARRTVGEPSSDRGALTAGKARAEEQFAVESGPRPSCAALLQAQSLPPPAGPPAALMGAGTQPDPLAAACSSPCTPVSPVHRDSGSGVHRSSMALVDAVRVGSGDEGLGI